MRDMTLKDCTKAELLFVIQRLEFYMLGSDAYYIQQALCDLEDLRDRRKHEEAQRLIDYAAQKQREYLSLLKAYEGKPLAGIPMPVLEKADAAMKELQAADQKWMRLMGIGRTCGKRKGR